ncbi:Protein CBG00968 [Caenorhabditis briggsae]|uniref:Protein CBG00968 n=3 Tax=Caenorhabditis briggsae TaxID=6238 RepID=A8WP78_CAEBR|nr:Protein CBG00968 [Caenorhabditis briggsae]CAP22284.1 Protein CBG00968 [Caenorhabditis briggsae]
MDFNTMDYLDQFPALIPLHITDISLDDTTIFINDDKVVVGIINDKIEVRSQGKVIGHLEFSEENLNLLTTLFIKSGQKVETFIAMKPNLLKHLPPIEVTMSLVIRDVEDEESWDFLRKCSGKPVFLNYRCAISEKLWEVPIIANSLGITLYGPVPFDVLRSLKNVYVYLKCYTPPVADLKRLYEHWKATSHEQRAIGFEINLKTFEDYKTNIKTWAPHSYHKPQFGFPPSKVFCVDFHSDKQIVFTEENVKANGDALVIMCIDDKTMMDTVVEMFGKLQGFVANLRGDKKTLSK